jgi:glycosyltransferase involved in cell wall biosynthesis
VRVVFLTHNYPRWPGDFSGAALGALARALVRRGVSVRVVAPSEDGAGHAELDGVSVQRVRIPGRLSHTISDQDGFAAALSSPLRWGMLLRLWRALKSAARREAAAGADVVHAHWWIPSGLATPAGVPVVLTIQGADAALLRDSRIARSLARPLLRRATVVTAVSRHVGESIQNLAGRAVGPQHIHPMPIDTRGHPWTRGGGGAVLLGRLDAPGRVDLALETVAVLASCGHDIPLTIIGDGPHRSALQQRAQRLGVSALVRFLGAMPADQARAHLTRADLMLFTAKGEGTAVAALEGLIAGVPVVACWDSGAAVDVVPESGAGRLCLPAAEAIADSVLSLRADKDRLALGRLVGEAWRTRLAPDHVAQLCEGWYRDALAR